MQTSFIPKKPVVDNHSSGSGISLFLLISIILFIVSVAVAGGVFVWKNSLVKQIAQNKTDLEAVRSSYEEGTINALIRLDDRIKQANILLSKHLAVSPVFLLMEKNILQKVRLKTLKFSYAPDNKIKVDLSGLARSYEVLSKQSDAFGSANLRDYISRPVISDFSLTPDGNISFNFNALVDPKLVSYTEMLKIGNTNQ